MVRYPHEKLSRRATAMQRLLLATMVIRQQVPPTHRPASGCGGNAPLVGPPLASALLHKGMHAS